MLVITGASGRYGRLLVDALLRRGTRPDALRATARDPSDLADLQALGVEVRKADFDQPETLEPAFAGASTLMLVPTSAIGRRHEQMKAAVTAALKAGVGRIGYAGFLNGDRNTFVLGEEHKQTEALIRQSAIRYLFFHNGPTSSRMSVSSVICLRLSKSASLSVRPGMADCPARVAGILRRLRQSP